MKQVCLKIFMLLLLMKWKEETQVKLDKKKQVYILLNNIKL